VVNLTHALCVESSAGHIQRKRGSIRSLWRATFASTWPAWSEKTYSRTNSHSWQPISTEV